MKTLLLLGGRSNRFWPLTEKPLYPICGKPLVLHQVERLQQGGCDNIILIASAYNKTAIEGLFPGYTVVEQDASIPGMHGALLAALPHCGEESVLIVGGNDFINPQAYTDLIKESQKDGVDGVILGQNVERYFPGGYLTLDGDRITGIVEKPGEGNEPSDYVNIVAHVHGNAKQLLNTISNFTKDDTRKGSDDIYEQALAKLFTANNYQISRYDGVWQAVKYPWHLLDLLPLLLDAQTPSIHPTADVHSTAVIDGDVTLEEGVRVFPNATIKGPCYIGKGSIVANNTLVRGSSVGEQCVIGYNTEVKGSLLHSHVWTHMTYIGDSVFGCNVSCGAGTVTGNFRLDEAEISSIVKDDRIATGRNKLGLIIGDDCRLGIQVSTDPGVKIGSGCFISSSTHVPVDVPNKKFVKLTNGVLDARENKVEVPGSEEREELRGKM